MKGKMGKRGGLTMSHSAGKSHVSPGFNKRKIENKSTTNNAREKNTKKGREGEHEFMKKRAQGKV